MPEPRVGPSGALDGLADALEARVSEIVASVVEVATSTGDPTDVGPIAEVVRRATYALAEQLRALPPPGLEPRGPHRYSGAVPAARAGAVPLLRVTRAWLRWRDLCVDVCADEGTRLALDLGAVGRALTAARSSCDAALVGACGAFDDERRRVQDALTERQAELSFQATHDALTGLANRAAILALAQEALVRARRRRTTVAALFVDLDNFKDVNDTLGHRAGDELLRAVATRLDAPTRGAVLGRLGGDEFVVLLEDLTGPEHAFDVAARLLESFRDPFRIDGLDGRALSVTASIGIAAGERQSAEDLLRDADIAMYRAKWSGRNRAVAFEPEMQWAARTRLELEIELQSALDRGEFFLVYQPTFDLSDMRVTGVEALLRWRHPERGTVAPGEFIPQLETTGAIVSVGRWVLDEACRQGAAWHAFGHEIAISVNVSARQIESATFVDDVRAALEGSGLPAGLLTIEITETAIVRDLARSAICLESIRAIGARIAVDDFGTGYSSLAHLQCFPVDALKIDRSFVSGMLQGRESEALVHTLVQLGRALGIETLAEGIEELPQLAHLRGEKCASGQGFLFAEPLPADEIRAFFANWSGGVAALGTA
ncbi:MAG TPA: EAL domain-containing protein [Acidimicrobiales bacterium]|nr:EAL domain-containing protein [Acidimicrobiales bacterium]